MPNFEIITGNVNTATLKRKELNGKTYLVGPVIMAREIVMNGLLYQANDLKASVIHWNGCPVVKGHPKDSEGAYISANSPDVIEEVGLGIVYNTSFDKENRLRAELWIDTELLDKHSDVKDVIEAGDMLEVSTGLFTVHESKKGKFKGREYKAIARNHKPDHLAILLNEVGACSVEDGAGFPRVNAKLKEKEIMEVNALSGGDLYAMLSKAVRLSFKGADGSWAYMLDTYDDSVIFERYNPTIGSYDTFKSEYVLSEDETKITFKGTPKKVLVRKTYVDDPDTNVIQQEHKTTGDSTSPESNGETQMNQKEIIAKMVSEKKIDANAAKVLEGMTPEQFEVYQKAFVVPHNPKATLPTTENNSEGVEEETEKEETEEVNKKKEGKGGKCKSPEANEEAEANAETVAWAKSKLATEKAKAIETILANKANTFVKEELQSMSINTLEKMASLATVKTTDMRGAGATVDGNAGTKPTVSKVKPYVQA